MKNELDDFLLTTVDSGPGDDTPRPSGTGPGLFDYINDLSEKKELLAFQVEEQNLKFPSEVVPYMINKAFGNFCDTVFYANALNRFNMSPESTYLFYTYAVPKKRRFSKWYKPDESKEKDIQNLMKYYEWGRNEALENYKLFSKEELKELSEKFIEKTQKIKTKRKK